MPVRTAVLALDGDYEGWSATVRTNPRSIVLDEFGSEDFMRIRKALAQIVLTWNFVDEDGEPLPAPDAGGVDACPPDLIGVLIQAYTQHVQALAGVPKG